MKVFEYLTPLKDVWFRTFTTVFFSFFWVWFLKLFALEIIFMSSQNLNLIICLVPCYLSHLTYAEKMAILYWSLNSCQYPWDHKIESMVSKWLRASELTSTVLRLMEMGLAIRLIFKVQNQVNCPNSVFHRTGMEPVIMTSSFQGSKNICITQFCMDPEFWQNFNIDQVCLSYLLLSQILHLSVNLVFCKLGKKYFKTCPF
jgi:hypothetical protein